ncbi:hypothetical protein AJ80_07066 [Polytolypa hystricis UAMH7299]|uniref:Fungal calcium binding protein domain-containing protein n=1 Tax=Polytolypa hystricis (strain UAMH7299) TaxID=1447883 RepID=A0A2B7XQW1_POLH7|nr:hypothetical protein AJ80_07066 [Polytolypa hystricis UAMH7299]
MKSLFHYPVLLFASLISMTAALPEDSNVDALAVDESVTKLPTIYACNVKICMNKFGNNNPRLQCADVVAKASQEGGICHDLSKAYNDKVSSIYITESNCECWLYE